MREKVLAQARGVLHPTDYSEASGCAFQIACRLTAGGQVTVLHVPEPPDVPFGTPLPPGYRGAWESQLGLVRSPYPTVRVDHRLEEGDPATEIVRLAGEPAYDLIVMGAGRRGGLWRTFMGSVSRAVVRRAHCPVVRVTVPEKRSYPRVPGRVLLATDSREPDAYLLALAQSLALGAGDELFVLSVRTVAQSGPDGGWIAKHRLTTRVPGMTPLVRVGSLDEEVLRAARDLRPATVVIGTRRRTGFGELFDPARVVRREAAFPVLSVHLPTREWRPVPGVAGRAGTSP
jgi:nucleotide-binding universal stress UspA family protein